MCAIERVGDTVCWWIVFLNSWLCFRSLGDRLPRGTVVLECPSEVSFSFRQFYISIGAGCGWDGRSCIAVRWIRRHCTRLRFYLACFLDLQLLDELLFSPWLWFHLIEGSRGGKKGSELFAMNFFPPNSFPEHRFGPSSRWWSVYECDAYTALNETLPKMFCLTAKSTLLPAPVLML